MQNLRYTVVGVDRASGNDIEWMIDAASEENARAKAELRGAVVTSIRELNETVTPAEGESGDGPGERTPADEVARRWPWKRVAKWTYNWYLLLGIWIVFGLLRNLGAWSSFQEWERRHTDAWTPDTTPIPPGLLATATVEFIGALVLIALMFVAQRLMKKRIDSAAKVVQWLLIVGGAVYVADAIAVNYAFPQFARNLVSTIVFHVVLCAIFLPLIMPLRGRRFAAFSRMLTDLTRDGVPDRFVANAAAGDVAQPQLVPSNERRVKYSWSKLVRAVLTGKVVIPEGVEVGLEPATALMRRHEPQPAVAATVPLLATASRPTAIAPAGARRSVWRDGVALGLAALAAAAGLLVLLHTTGGQGTPATATASQVPSTAPRPTANPKEHWPAVFDVGNNDVPSASDDDLASGQKTLEDMAGTYGYYVAQTSSIEARESKFPHYRGQLESARATFDIRFKSAVDNIDRILEKKVPDWAQTRRQVRQEAQQQIHPGSLTENGTRGFLEELRARSEGKMPILETLLMFDPTYMAQPAREFLDGYKQVYRSDGSAASYGLRFTIEYPRSWRAEATQRQNVLQSFTDEDGRGTTLLVLSAAEVPGTLGGAVDLDGAIDQLHDGGIEAIWKGVGANNLKNLDSGIVTLSGRHTAWSENTCTMNRVGIEMGVHGLVFAFADHNRFVYLTLMSAAVPGVSKVTADDEFKRHARLFQLMLNSVIEEDGPVPTIQ